MTNKALQRNNVTYKVHFVTCTEIWLINHDHRLHYHITSHHYHNSVVYKNVTQKTATSEKDAYRASQFITWDILSAITRWKFTFAWSLNEIKSSLSEPTHCSTTDCWHSQRMLTWKSRAEILFLVLCITFIINAKGFKEEEENNGEEKLTRKQEISHFEQEVQLNTESNKCKERCNGTRKCCY